jgi:hypothetical protein
MWRPETFTATLSGGRTVPALAGPAGRGAARRGERPPAERHDQVRGLGQGDERARRDQPPLGVLPANERLGAHRAARREVDDGLVVQHQLVVGQRAAQVRLELQPLDRRGVHRRREGLEAPLAAFLRLVEREVRVPEQVVGALAAARDRDPDARGDADLPTAEGDGRRDRRDHAGGGHGGGLVVRHRGEEDRELVAAEPATVSEPRVAPRRPLGDRGEERVARGVPEAVVHRLELVEVDEEHRGHARGAGCASCAASTRSRKRGPVGEPRERVDERPAA